MTGHQCPRGQPGPISIVGLISALVGGLKVVSDPLNQTILIAGIGIILVDFAIEYEW